MARITGGTVQQQACLKQQIEKEEATALRFFVQNIEKLKVPSGASAVLRKKLEQTKVDAARCNRLAEEAAKRAEERRKAAAESAIKVAKSELTSQDLSAMLDMRPPSPATKALLYNGISHDRHGRSFDSTWWESNVDSVRAATLAMVFMASQLQEKYKELHQPWYQYLKARYQRDPEEKFPFPLPISWDYGWRLADTVKREPVKKSPYGHVSIVKNTFFNRTGISFGEEAEPKPWYAC